MDITVEVNAFKDLLASAQSILVVLPEQASRDAVAAGLSLYLTLSQLQKTVTIAYPKPPTVALSHLVGINKLTQHVGNKNFVISLDYIEGSIEKVSYNIDGNKFNLVIEPRPGVANFSDKNISYSYSGTSADLIITLEAATLDSLGKFYTDNKTLFDEKPLLVIDNRTTNTQYGKVNLVRPQASISEIVAQIIKSSELPIDQDIATNLYDGVVFGSRNFASPSVNADTFEAAAWLLKQGARKTRPAGREEIPQREFPISTSTEAPQAPPDWLKPKIYKGSQLL